MLSGKLCGSNTPKAVRTTEPVQNASSISWMRS